MLKDMLSGIGALTLAEKMALEEVAKADVARELGAQGAAAHDAAPASEAVGSLGMVNALHQRLKQLLGRFAGVSTRRLGHTWPGSGGPSILHLTLLEDLPQVVGEVGLGASGRRALAGHEA